MHMMRKVLQRLRLGDRLEWFLRKTKLDRFASDRCGCEKRKAMLNGDRPR